MEYLSPSRRLRIPKKKIYHWTRTRQKACSFQVPSSAPRTFFSSLPTTWNTKRRTVVLNRVCIWEIFCPKQSQGFKHSAAYPYPNIGRVPPLGSLNPNPSLYPNIGRVPPFPGSRSLYGDEKEHVLRLCLHQIPYSFCAGAETIPDKASVQTPIS